MRIKIVLLFFFVFYNIEMVFAQSNAIFNTGNGSGYYRSCTAIDSPLPIQLVSFSAKWQDSSRKIVVLNWTTASETNNDYFTIEKTKDGQSYEYVANLKSSGNSSSILNYSAIDDNPYQGISYYRLKQTDFNGIYTYSKLVSVELKKLINFNIYPNPFNEFTIIDFTNVKESIDINLLNKQTSLSFHLYNILGKEVLVFIDISEEKTLLKKNNLEKGVYFYKIIMNEKCVGSGKLIVQ